MYAVIRGVLKNQTHAPLAGKTAGKRMKVFRQFLLRLKA
jgi:hypothetical protein